MYITHMYKHVISVVLTQTLPSCETTTDLILVRHFPTFFEAFLYTCNTIQSVVTHSVTRTKTYVTLYTSGLLQRDLISVTCSIYNNCNYDTSKIYSVKAFQVFVDLKNS